MQISTYKINALAHVSYIVVPCSSLSLQKTERWLVKILELWLQLSHTQEADSTGLSFLIYKTGHGAGKTVQWFKALALLVEGLDLGPSVHMVAHNHAELEFQGEMVLPPGLHGTRHACSAFKYMQAKSHTHKIKNK